MYWFVGQLMTDLILEMLSAVLVLSLVLPPCGLFTNCIRSSSRDKVSSMLIVHRTKHWIGEVLGDRQTAI